MMNKFEAKKIIVIGCPGSGKSTFARKLCDAMGLPLYYLDMLFHRPDRTTAAHEEFDAALAGILAKDRWIIDGNYLRTLPMRLAACDAVFFFDLPTKQCLEGASSRIGTVREDLPWVETELDPDFCQYILDFPSDQLPRIRALLQENCIPSVDASGFIPGKPLDRNKPAPLLITFTSREQSDGFISDLLSQNRM